MKLIQKAFSLTEVEYNKKHLEIVSTLLPTNLTNKEIEVLASFMAVEDAIKKQGMFNTLARKIVMKNLNLSAGGLGNHLKSMLEKKVLDKDEETGDISMKDFLIPQSPIQGYQIKIIKNNK